MIRLYKNIKNKKKFMPCNNCIGKIVFWLRIAIVSI